MHEDPWQVFAENGQPIDGQSITPSDSRVTDETMVGAAHVWVWRHTDDGIEVLLQKRSKEKPTWPGYFDISTAGHINVGESPVEAVCREAREELGLDIDIDRLVYFFGYRNFDNGLNWVYLCRATGDENFVFNDGEVESVHWIGLDDLANMIDSPNSNNLVPHSDEYFSMLIAALKCQ